MVTLLAHGSRLGVDWAHINVNDASLHNVEGYVGLKKRCAQYGLQVYRIAKHDVHNQPEITLGLPGRDKKIQDLCDFITNIGAAGIHYHTYAHMATGIWSSGRTEGRGGLTARKFDPETAVGSWDGKVFPNDGMVHGRPYSEEELWEHYTYFIKKLAPVAEAAGVFIGIHPDDPPFYSLGGVPRCIFGTFEGYKRALEIADSPNIGVCLCLGCWLEGGAELMGADALTAIRTFAGMGKLFKVHFRNVSNPMGTSAPVDHGDMVTPAGGPWQESLLDEGYMDMHKIMACLEEVGFDGCAIPDHIPNMNTEGAGLGYSIAYMRALVQSVSKRPYQPINAQYEGSAKL